MHFGMVIGMSIAVRLRDDLKIAMKSKDELKKSVIRLALAGLKNAELEKGAPLSESEEVDVMARQAKMRRESIEEYENLFGNRKVHSSAVKKCIGYHHARGRISGPYWAGSFL